MGAFEKWYKKYCVDEELIYGHAKKHFLACWRAAQAKGSAATGPQQQAVICSNSVCAYCEYWLSCDYHIKDSTNIKCEAFRGRKLTAC